MSGYGYFGGFGSGHRGPKYFSGDGARRRRNFYENMEDDEYYVSEPDDFYPGFTRARRHYRTTPVGSSLNLADEVYAEIEEQLVRVPVSASGGTAYAGSVTDEELRVLQNIRMRDTDSNYRMFPQKISPTQLVARWKSRHGPPIAALTEEEKSSLARVRKLHETEGARDLVYKCFNDWDRALFHGELKNRVLIAWLRSPDSHKMSGNPALIQRGLNHVGRPFARAFILLDTNHFTKTDKKFWGTLVHCMVHCYFMIMTRCDEDGCYYENLKHSHEFYRILASCKLALGDSITLHPVDQAAIDKITHLEENWGSSKEPLKQEDPKKPERSRFGGLFDDESFPGSGGERGPFEGFDGRSAFDPDDPFAAGFDDDDDDYIFDDPMFTSGGGGPFGAGTFGDGPFGGGCDRCNPFGRAPFDSGDPRFGARFGAPPYGPGGFPFNSSPRPNPFSNSRSHSDPFGAGPRPPPFSGAGPSSSSGGTGARSTPQPAPKEKPNPYKILGVSRTAPVDDIKKAWRKLSVQNHPDKVPAERRDAATKRMQEINHAWDMLSDPARKAYYDRTGLDREAPGKGATAGGFGGS